MSLWALQRLSPALLWHDVAASVAVRKAVTPPGGSDALPPAAQLTVVPQNQRHLPGACPPPSDTAREGLRPRCYGDKGGKGSHLGDRKEHKVTEKLDWMEVNGPRARPRSVKITRGERP